MCKAVEVLHQKNICHRDIALRNLLLSNDKEHVVLSDFSLSRTLNSAIERQCTLTAIVPANCPPETFKNSKTSTPGSEVWERFYSLKSDIWSLGIVIFEIVNKQSINIAKTQRPPSGFQTERLPSTKIFDRIAELWIQIIRCWDEKPERRPQSWEVHEGIKILRQNPLNIVNENERYSTYFSDKASPNLYHYKDTSWQSFTTLPGVYTDCTRMSTFSVDALEHSGSFMPEIQSGSISYELESPDFINHLITKDLIDRFAKVNKLRIQVNGDKSSSNKHKLFKLKMFGDENVSNEYTSLAPGTPSPNSNTVSPNIKVIKSTCMNSSRRKMYDQSIAHSQGRPGIRFINLGSHSSFGSCLSMYSHSLISLEEVPEISERLQYCNPLSASIRSSPTNIKYCHDRHFFQNAAQNLMSEEKSEISPTPDTEVVEQSPSAYQLSKIECETPRFLVYVN